MYTPTDFSQNITRGREENLVVKSCASSETRLSAGVRASSLGTVASYCAATCRRSVSGQGEVGVFVR